jgi:hypothetical protein
MVSLSDPRARQGERSQGVEIHFDVDLGGLGIAVTQQLTDLTERRSHAQHVSGQSMPKLMCSISGGINAGAL